MPNDPHTEAIPAAFHVLSLYGVDTPELTPVKEGLINLTWRVDPRDGVVLILQRLHPIFPPQVNLNLERVTRHLAARGLETPRLFATKAGDWWVAHDGATWRVMSYINGRSFTTLPDLRYATSAGRLLGDFHRALSDFSSELPCERAPVHAPTRHFANLAAVLVTAPQHRHHHAVTTITDEIERAFAALPTVPVQPARMLHGDPKLSNLLFGPAAAPCCLVDLDTVGYAPLVYELGDAFRSWCNPHPEDASTAHFDLKLFAAAIDGYAFATIGFIEAAEIAAIVTAIEIIFLELAARFAHDAIGESYFGWDPHRFATRGDHNLQRARNQLEAARSLRAQRSAAEAEVLRAFESNAIQPHDA